jgi:F-type H+-transporting ATPase subunit epsilon
MPKTFELEIATPERLLVKEHVTEAQIPGAEGEMGVLVGHAPLLSRLGIGLLSYTAGGRQYFLMIADGIVEILPNHVRVLAVRAEKPDEVDTTRAEAAMKRAAERLRSPKEVLDYARAQSALKRAQARIELAKKK